MCGPADMNWTTQQLFEEMVAFFLIATHHWVVHAFWSFFPVFGKERRTVSVVGLLIFCLVILHAQTYASRVWLKKVEIIVKLCKKSILVLLISSYQTLFCLFLNCLGCVANVWVSNKEIKIKKSHQLHLKSIPHLLSSSHCRPKRQSLSISGRCLVCV